MGKSSKHFRRLVVPVTLATLTPLARQRIAQAADPANWKTFTSSGAGNWSTAGSWTTGSPTSGTTLTINFDPSAVGSVNGNGTVTGSFLSTNDMGTVQLHTLTLGGAAATTRTITIGSGALQFEGSGASISNTTSGAGAGVVNYIIGSDVLLNTDTTFSNTGAGLTTFTGTVSTTSSGLKTLTTTGTGSVSFNNATLTDGSGTLAVAWSSTGTLTLQGTNTLTGGIRVNSGIVLAGSNSASLGGSNNVVTLGGASGTADASLQTSSSLTYAAGILVASGTSLNTVSILSTSNSSTSTFSGNVTLQRDLLLGVTGSTATLQMSGTISGNGGITASNLSGGTVKLTGTINNTGTITNSSPGTGGLNISGVVGSSVQGVIQNSAGSTLSMSGANTSMAANITVKRGTLSLSSNASAAGSGTILLGDTSALNSDNATFLVDSRTWNNNVTVQAGGLGTATMGNGGSAAVFAGLVTLNKDLTLASNGTGTVRLSATVSGAALTGSGNLIVTSATPAATNVTVGGNNSGFTGSVSVVSGSFKLDTSSGTALSAANAVAVDSLNSATFELNNNSVTIAGLRNGSNGGGVVNNSGAARILTIGGNGTYSFGGDITATTVANLGLNVSLTGNGSQTLSGTTHYAGATNVISGRLIVDGNIAASSGVSVSSGATLAGSGTTSSVTAAGVVSPGTSKGVLSTGNLTLSGGTLAVDLSKAGIRAGQSPLAGTDYDQLNVAGAVSLSSASLALTPTAGIQNGDLYFIVVNDGADAVNGTFTGLPAGVFTTQGLQFQISYTADSTSNSMINGNDIALQAIAVPEPSTLSLLTIGGLAMLRRRRANGPGRAR